VPGLSLSARRLAPTSAAGRGEEDCARRLASLPADGRGEEKQYLDMGNSMESMSGPGVPERGTGQTHARHTAGGPTTDIASPSMPAQPPGKTLVPPDHPSGQTDLKLADAVNTNVKNTTVVGQAARDVEAPEQRSEKPDSTESSVREGKQPSLVPDSGYGRHCGPGSWIPRNSGSLLVRCPIARAVAGAGLRCVTVIIHHYRHHTTVQFNSRKTCYLHA